MTTDLQSEGIDTPEFRALTMAYAKAITGGSVPESSTAWASLVTYIETWKAAAISELTTPLSTEHVVEAILEARLVCTKSCCGVPLKFCSTDEWKGELQSFVRCIERKIATRNKPAAMRCPQCRAPRKGTSCHKCFASLVAMPADWTEKKMPPLERIRELAREVGYAIAVHGTQERDLDIVAAPWTTDAVGNHALLKHLAKGLQINGKPAFVRAIERKPHGRYAATILMEGAFKDIDISIYPTVRHPNREHPPDMDLAFSVYYPEFLADDVAQKYETSFSAWVAASYPSEYLKYLHKTKNQGE